MSTIASDATESCSSSPRILSYGLGTPMPLTVGVAVHAVPGPRVSQFGIHSVLLPYVQYQVQSCKFDWSEKRFKVQILMVFSFLLGFP
jgi:hypothetical protein